MRILCALVVLLAVQPARAADPAKVSEAIAKAAEYFKARINRAGDGPGRQNMHGMGEVALMGLAMLEANVPPSDPAMKKIIQEVREGALLQTQTYHISLTIFFLDRLGDPADVPFIQMLGVRLYAGMNANGGWTYNSWDAAPDQNELVRLTKALQNQELIGQPRQDNKAPGGKAAPGAAPARTGRLHSEVEKVATLVSQTIRARGRATAGDDNSNTQFGMIGLWIACRNGLPAHDAFTLIEKRFLVSQNPNDAGWGYQFPAGMVKMIAGSTPSMTCAGLLGLALGAGARENKLVGEKRETVKPVDPKKNDPDPFSNPNDPNLPKAAPKEKPDANKLPKNLPNSVKAALTSLGQFLNAAKNGNGGGPVGPGPRRPGKGMPGVPGGGDLGGFVGLGNQYYLLWSLERMAMAYSLDTIGGIDWHDYGASILLPAQNADGSWNDGQYGAEVNTALAVLFLAKSNLVRDLSGKIRGTKDPGNAELRGSNAPPLLAPPPVKEAAKPGDNANPGGTPATPSPQPATTPTTGGFTLPPVVVPTEAAEAEKEATAILTAQDDWQKKLETARDSRGGKWSRALALVCAKADGERRKEAREALAERLTRMTAATLKTMLNDEDAELRRAACLAVGMKDAKTLIPDLIDRLTDASDPTVRAARAALKSLSGVDFGPAAGSDEDARITAANNWRAWYESLKK